MVFYEDCYIKGSMSKGSRKWFLCLYCVCGATYRDEVGLATFAFMTNIYYRAALNIRLIWAITSHGIALC
jgi:hypothetical protein